jgi:hypothetical protein
VATRADASSSTIEIRGTLSNEPVHIQFAVATERKLSRA